ncbi:MAG: VWA domain-containing protein [Rhodobacteraceae bacterium]|nr:VWA domain-containing protein [Paracoccaceae bacterium]
MSEDDLARLRAALEAATPAPDPARRAAHLRLAEATFAEGRQGTAGRARQSLQGSAEGAPRTGVLKMLDRLTSRAALAVTASAVAVAAAAWLLILPQGDPRLSGPPAGPAPVTGRATPAPTPAADATTAAAGNTEGGTLPLPAVPAARPAGREAAAPAAAADESLAHAPAPGLADPAAGITEEDRERYATATPNPVKVTAEEPVSTFSIDVDTASWSYVRRYLLGGELPPAEAVRIEEMINYFPYDWPAPAAGEGPFRTTVAVTAAPWNPDTRLVHIALRGELPAIADRPPLDLVFLVDTSGSMQGPDRLDLLKQGLRMMLAELRPEDRVAIVAYAGSAGEVLAPTPASDRAAILAALDRLEAGGSTAGQEGLQQAYATARAMAGEGRVSRILLATDGDFNVGISDPEELTRYVAREREGGTYLSVLGFGRGNINDTLMQALAQNGNGTAAYIDTLAEARKVLVDQLTGALFPIADDVKIQVEWNPAAVAEYRLIGYETRALARTDFANDRVDAGEIGAGHTVTAIYEVVPVGSPARLTDDLRYAPPARVTGADELGFLRLRYKLPGAGTSTLVEQPILPAMSEAGDDIRFSAAIAGFGQLLIGSPFLGDWGWDEAIALAEGARGADPFGWRVEAVTLMRLAESLAGAN